MEEEQTLRSYDFCISCVPAPTVRDFLMPGIFHYTKNVFTRYQLVMELLHAELETMNKAEEENPIIDPDWPASLEIIAQETAEAYSEEVEPFILLINTLYSSPEVLEERFPQSTHKPRRTEAPRRSESKESNPGPTASTMAELLKISGSSLGAQINISPQVDELSRNYCCRIFGPISTAVYLLLKESGAERVELEVSRREGKTMVMVSSPTVLEQRTVYRYSCEKEETSNPLGSPRYPCSVLCHYRYTDGIGKLFLSP
ncbi:MAG: hypothetical protein R6V67_06885 [Spirochaetia bacterium]